MKLSVTEIRFLSSGAVSVEVGAGASMDRGTTTAVDAVRFQVFIPKTMALKAVKAFAIE